eukprot:TRINITY_DN32680_c0_g1_i1.p1 TRINITY_DN32680_c0_g1~~TRINITY_DN32680_c0_g1_i1.p1  ORF type:complete len:418 (+),score=107.64 TRINITY_DN32680_c0_g1_i1:59-1312(+)
MSAVADMVDVQEGAATSSAVSLISSLLVITTHWWAWERHSHFTKRLLFCLTILDALSQVHVLVSSVLVPQDGTICAVSGCFFVVLQTAAPVWTACMSFALHYSVFEKPRPSFLIKYLLMCTAAVALFLGGVAAVTGALGRQQGWEPLCGARSAQLRLFIAHAPVAIILVVNAVVAVVVARETKRTFPLHMTTCAVHRHRMYPLLLAAVWPLSTVVDLTLAYSDSAPPRLLLVCAVMMQRSQGLLNAMVYFSDPVVRDELLTCCTPAKPAMGPLEMAGISAQHAGADGPPVYPISSRQRSGSAAGTEEEDVTTSPTAARLRPTVRTKGDVVHEPLEMCWDEEAAGGLVLSFQTLPGAGRSFATVSSPTNRGASSTPPPEEIRKEVSVIRDGDDYLDAPQMPRGASVSSSATEMVDLRI